MALTNSSRDGLGFSAGLAGATKLLALFGLTMAVPSGLTKCLAAFSNASVASDARMQPDSYHFRIASTNSSCVPVQTNARASARIAANSRSWLTSDCRSKLRDSRSIMSFFRLPMWSSIAPLHPGASMSYGEGIQPLHRIAPASRRAFRFGATILSCLGYYLDSLRGLPPPWVLRFAAIWR
jgi:hypothetical protein